MEAIIFILLVSYFVIGGLLAIYYWAKAAYSIVMYLHHRNRLYPELSHVQWYSVSEAQLKEEYSDLLPHKVKSLKASKKCAVVWGIYLSCTFALLFISQIIQAG